ncbi:hypothetical protein GCM10018775_03390 [Streptomyces umbrinus]|nr:hypothetical protein GCM10018775_03390 [Streptomyces umbrinus]
MAQPGIPWAAGDERGGPHAKLVDGQIAEEWRQRLDLRCEELSVHLVCMAYAQ